MTGGLPSGESRCGTCCGGLRYCLSETTTPSAPETAADRIEKEHAMPELANPFVANVPRTMTKQELVQAVRVEPVSYTHLDVYKRQVAGPGACCALGGFVPFTWTSK